MRRIMVDLCVVISYAAVVYLTSVAAGALAQIIYLWRAKRGFVTRPIALMLALYPPAAGLLAISLPLVQLPAQLHFPLHTLMQHVAQNQRIHSILHVLDICLMVLVIARLLYAIYSISRTVAATSILTRSDHPVRIICGYPVRLLPTSALYCFTAGFIKPEVYLSEGMLQHLTTQHISAILAHEAGHVKKRDGLWSLLLQLLYNIQFMPWSKRRLETWQLAAEIDCDALAAETVSARHVVADALLTMAELSATSRVPFGTAFHAKKSDVEVRISALLNQTHSSIVGTLPMKHIAAIWVVSVITLVITKPIIVHVAELIAYH
jgi:Zn-dependent protease with chaperone function